MGRNRKNQEITPSKEKFSPVQVTCLLWMYGAIHQSRCAAYIFLPRTRVVYIRLLDDSSPFPTSQWECQIVLVLLSLGAVNQCVCDKNRVVFFSDSSSGFDWRLRQPESLRQRRVTTLPCTWTFGWMAWLWGSDGLPLKACSPQAIAVKTCIIQLSLIISYHSFAIGMMNLNESWNAKNSSSSWMTTIFFLGSLCKNGTLLLELDVQVSRDSAC